MKRIKNKDIASELGISTAAVSLAINNKPGVSDETRRKVLAMIEAGGGGNVSVTSQRTVGKNNTLLFVVHKRHGEIIIDKPFFSDLIESVQMEATRHNYTMMVSHYTWALDLHSYVDSLNDLKPAGIVLLATEMLSEDLSEYKRLAAPFVLLDSAFDTEEFDCVSIDNQNAILRAFEYAYSMGHRDVGYLRSSVYINNFDHRFDGYLKGIRLYNLEHRNHPVFSLHSNVEMSYQQMRNILEHRPSNLGMPTCFLSDLDYIAIGAMSALKEFGYRIPEDVSVIGFDDVTSCEIYQPPLTTMRVNRTDIGRIAVTTLLERVHTPHSYYTQTYVSSDLIVRDSVKRITEP